MEEEVDPFALDMVRIKKRLARDIPYLKICWRDEWGAQDFVDRKLLDIPVRKLLLTYTETPVCTTDEECLKTVQELQRKQMRKGSSDIHWNFLVGGNGTIYEGRGFNVVAKKISKFKRLRRSFDIAYIASKHEELTDYMKFSRGQFIRFAFMEWVIKEPLKVIEDKVPVKTDDDDKQKKSKKDKKKKKQKKEKKIIIKQN